VERAPLASQVQWRAATAARGMSVLQLALSARPSPCVRLVASATVARRRAATAARAMCVPLAARRTRQSRCAPLARSASAAGLRAATAALGMRVALGPASRRLPPPSVRPAPSA
jgi:hypothetical protein